MIMTMRKRKRERETCREAGKKVVSPEMKELEGKMPARREARSREARSPTLWGLKRKRFERLTPFFIHPAEAAGDFPVDAEIFGERFTSKTNVQEGRWRSKEIVNSQIQRRRSFLFLEADDYVCFASKKLLNFFSPTIESLNRDLVNSSLIEQIGQRRSISRFFV